MRILIVEDDTILSQTLQAVLEKEGFSVDAVADGESGVDYILLNVYDLVILDVMLPVQDGYQVARTVRSKGCGTPILMLTARSAVDDRIDGLNVVYLVPLLIISLYPLVFSRYGEVYLPTSYGSIFAFFLLGAALIAVGIFLSSLTENQGFAAGLGIAVILLNYYSVTLSEHISATAFGTVVALMVVIVVIGVLVQYMTKNENLAYGVAAVLLVLLLAVNWIDSSLLEGLLPKIMTKLSLFERLNVFVNGMFDWTGVVYYLSVAVLFLFLSVQSLEKRRYN